MGHQLEHTWPAARVPLHPNNQNKNYTPDINTWLLPSLSNSGMIPMKSADCGGFYAQALQPDGPHFFSDQVLQGRGLPGATFHLALARRLSVP
jgi:hypothetical protein